ncbi:hypothetical protein [Estrella lausannensis]|uniref:Putative membrane protein n=1 Tax=Estrella lausannensis TaxID=483423 RepID=A0A0H5DTP0_9BACT|nr:hypothetical protein [Estrella lausannensis]CRX39239.1 Putative membrane protein [Estrella lausannensis]
MELLPVRNSVDSLFYRGIEHLNHSESGFVKQAVTRAVQMVAIPPIMILSVLYNAFAIALKAPVTLMRYTIGFIPTEKGKLADMFPEDSTASHMAWHAYKILLFWVDIVPLYLVGIIHPGANVFIHKKMALIPSIKIDIEVDKTSPESPKVNIEVTVSAPSVLPPPVPSFSPPLPPPLPPPNWKVAEKAVTTPSTNATGKKTRPLPKIPMEALLKKAIGDHQKKAQKLAESGQTIESLIPKKDKMMGMFNMTIINQKLAFIEAKQEDDSIDETPTLDSEWETDDLPPFDPSPILDDTLSAIMNAPKVTYQLEEVTDKTPVHVVPTDIANSDHYKKMAFLHKMQEEDDSDWEID